mgnify:CR=1 FL=1
MVDLFGVTGTDEKLDKWSVGSEREKIAQQVEQNKIRTIKLEDNGEDVLITIKYKQKGIWKKLFKGIMRQHSAQEICNAMAAAIRAGDLDDVIKKAHEESEQKAVQSL